MSASAASSLSPRKPVAYQGMWTTPATSGPDLGPDRRRLGRRRPAPALALGAGADEDGDLAEVLILVHQLVGLRDLVEAHRTPEHRADEPRVDEPVGLVALPRVGEVGPHDLLLAHPQVADVEVEVVAARSPAYDDLAERLDREDRRRERRLAHVLEDDVGAVAQQRPDALGEVAADRGARALLLGGLAAAAHHARELRAVDPALDAELLEQG